MAAIGHFPIGPLDQNDFRGVAAVTRPAPNDGPNLSNAIQDLVRMQLSYSGPAIRFAPFTQDPSKSKGQSPVKLQQAVQRSALRNHPAKIGGCRTDNRAGELRPVLQVDRVKPQLQGDTLPDLEFALG